MVGRGEDGLLDGRERGEVDLDVFVGEGEQGVAGREEDVGLSVLRVGYQEDALGRCWRAHLGSGPVLSSTVTEVLLEKGRERQKPGNASRSTPGRCEGVAQYMCEVSASLPHHSKHMTPSRTLLSRSRIVEDTILATEREKDRPGVPSTSERASTCVSIVARLWDPLPDGRNLLCTSKHDGLSSPSDQEQASRDLPGLTPSSGRHPGGTRQANRPHIRIDLRGQSSTRAAGDSVMSPSIPIGWATRETVCGAEAYLDPRWSLGCQPGSGGLPRQPQCLGGCIVLGHYRVGHSAGMAPQYVD